MATIKEIQKCEILSVGPPKSSIQRKGNGRRLAGVLRSNPDADIPDTVDVADHAEYEVHCRWTTVIFQPRGPHPNEDYPPEQITECDLTAQDSMVFLSNGEGTGRPAHSKIVLTAGAEKAYAILTWADLFGYSIKESQLGRKGPKGGCSQSGWILYAKLLDEEQLGELREALYQAGVDY